MMAIFEKYWGVWVETLLPICGESHAIAIAFSLLLVELFTFYIPCVLFEVFEEQLESKRIEADKSTKQEVNRRAWKDVTITVFIVHPLLAIGFRKWLGSTLVFSGEVPSALDFLYIFVSGLICNDLGFYWAHRLFHEFPSLYKLHKIHHEFNFTRGIAAQYCHPIEGVVCNTLPSFINMIVWYNIFGQINVLLVGFWLGFRLLETLDAHNGFFISFSFCPTHWGDLGEGKYGIHHYFHHSHNTGNYGTPLLDRIFGTDDTYRTYVEGKKAKTKKKS